jgi:hypothetical protein
MTKNKTKKEEYHCEICGREISKEDMKHTMACAGNAGMTNSLKKVKTCSET